MVIAIISFSSRWRALIEWMDAVWDLLSFISDTLSPFCPVQFFPSAGLGGTQVLDIQGQRYRVLKQVQDQDH